MRTSLMFCEKMIFSKRFFLIFLFTFSLLHSQNLEGLSGLFYIPTADLGKDCVVTTGASFADKKLISFSGYNVDAVAPFVSINFLPFVEISIRITHLLDSKITSQGLGDRTFSIRLKLLSEDKYLPSLLVGIHDLLAIYGGTSAIHNNASYFVVSKHINLNTFISDVGIHSGYGIRIFRANNYNFDGFFGGVNIQILKSSELMFEYDAEYFNTGVRFTFFDKIKLLAGLIDMKYFSGAVSVSFQL